MGFGLIDLETLTSFVLNKLNRLYSKLICADKYGKVENLKKSFDIYQYLVSCRRSDWFVPASLNRQKLHFCSCILENFELGILTHNNNCYELLPKPLSKITMVIGEHKRNVENRSYRREVGWDHKCPLTGRGVCSWRFHCNSNVIEG